MSTSFFFSFHNRKRQFLILQVLRAVCTGVLLNKVRIDFVTRLCILVGHIYIYICFMLTTGKGNLPTIIVEQGQNLKQDDAVVDLIHDSCKTGSC